MKISLRAARVNAELCQKDVARELGVDKVTIISWEKQRTMPRIDQLENLCALYSMPIDCIFLHKMSAKSELKV